MSVFPPKRAAHAASATFPLLLVSELCLALEAGPAARFEGEILPILQAHCHRCHGGGRNKGGLDLRQRRTLRRGGDTRAAILPGKPDESFLLERVREGEMPPGDLPKLSAAEIETLRAWIAAGAPLAAAEEPPLPEAPFVGDADRQFWSFLPIRRPPPPPLRDGTRARTPLDVFFLARLEAKGLGFAPEADKLTLLRRLSFDLLGLPPSRDAALEFLGDPDADAYERLVERLLASPHYGERWGRHWLDVAGYADSEGAGEADLERPHAWKYRDWVIDSLNADLGYDRFLLEQLAGDELAGYPLAELAGERLRLVTATGFLRQAADGTGEADSLTARNQALADTVRIVASATLGLTLGCAQCHDHRYDPLSQQDYHRVRAAFEPAYNLAAWKAPAARRLSLQGAAERQRAAAVDVEMARRREELGGRIRDKIAAVVEGLIDKDVALEERPALRAARQRPAAERSAEENALLGRYPQLAVSEGTLYQYEPAAAEEFKKARAAIDALAAEKPPEDFVRALAEEPGQVPQSRLLVRGVPDQPGEAVDPGVPEVLAPPGQLRLDPATDAGVASGRRLALGRWLTRPEQPLTARVIANRVWMHHFGRGLVATPGDFGTQGEPPSHPEVLDHLADELRASDWSLKRLHRLIVVSTVYRQGAAARPEGLERDAENVLYWRKPLLRLEGEALRDALLAAAGDLVIAMGGPSVPVREDAEGRIILGVEQKVDANLPGKEVPLGAAACRRSVYVQARRSRPLSFTKAFDTPVMELNCERRAVSVVAPQALTLLNGDFALRQSETLVARLEREAASAGERLALAFWHALGRPPRPEEEARALAYFDEEVKLCAASAGAGAVEAAAARIALGRFVHVLFNTSEFLSVD